MTGWSYQKIASLSINGLQYAFLIFYLKDKIILWRILRENWRFLREWTTAWPAKILKIKNLQKAIRIEIIQIVWGSSRNWKKQVGQKWHPKKIQILFCRKMINVRISFVFFQIPIFKDDFIYSYWSESGYWNWNKNKFWRI